MQTRAGSAQGQRRGAEVGPKGAARPAPAAASAPAQAGPARSAESLASLAAEIQALGVIAANDADKGSEVSVILDAVRALQSQIQECRTVQSATTQRMLHLEAENAALRQQVKEREPSPSVELRDAPVGRSSQSASSTDPAPLEDSHRRCSSGSSWKEEEVSLRNEHEDRSQEILQRLAAVQEVQTKLLAKIDSKEEQSPDAAAGTASEMVDSEPKPGPSSGPSKAPSASPPLATRATRSSTVGSAQVMLSADSKLVDPASVAEARAMRRGMSFDISGVSASTFVEEDRAAGVSEERGCRRQAMSATAPPRVAAPVRPGGSLQLPAAGAPSTQSLPPAQGRRRSGALEKARLWAQERRNSAKVMAAAQAALLHEDEGGEATAEKSDEELEAPSSSSSAPAPEKQDGREATANAVPAPVKPKAGPDRNNAEWEALIHAKAPLNFSPTLETSLDNGPEARPSRLPVPPEQRQGLISRSDKPL